MVRVDRRQSGILLGVAALCLLAVPTPPVQADNCDSNCRMKQFFYVCGGNYYRYQREDCWFCVQFPGLLIYGVCEKAVTAQGDGSNCIYSGTNKRIIHNHSGDINCNCDNANKWWIEAAPETFTVGEEEWIGCDRYVCGAS
jgi:hypothetical protein